LITGRGRGAKLYRGNMILLPRLCHRYWAIFPLPLWSQHLCKACRSYHKKTAHMFSWIIV